MVNYPPVPAIGLEDEVAVGWPWEWVGPEEGELPPESQGRVAVL